MRLVRVGGASLNQTPLDYLGNVERIKQALAEARAESVDILCLPELCLSGYGCEDQFLGITTAQKSWQALESLLPHTKDMVVVFGLACLFRGYMYNCAAVVQDGEIIGINPKKILAREGIHYEQRWFIPWPRGVMATLESNQGKIPFGDQHYTFGGIGVAIEICEEAWGSDSPSTPHVAHGVHFILNPSASHFAMGKTPTRERLVAHWSRSQKVHYCYANLVGNEAGRVIYDGCVLFAEGGDIVARGPRLHFKETSVTTYDFDSDLANSARLQSYGVEARQSNAKVEAGSITGKPLHNTNQQHLLKPSKLVNSVHHSSEKNDYIPSLYEDFYQAQVLGLHDYLRKSKAKGCVVSLSGGVDSSATAALIAHSLAESLKALGSETLAKRLNLPDLANEKDPRTWVKKTLICIYQKTAHSSAATETAARQLAEEIGATFYCADVEPVVEQYHHLFQNATGRKLDWQQDDIALQNIQARVRAPLAWMLANTNNMLLVSTSNRSEAAVGYATMDGDTAGGLAPLAGIDKHFLIGFLRWMAEQQRFGLGSLDSISSVLSQPPSAELRPGKAKQTDEEDLMPYEILARIERLFVRDRMNKTEIIRCLESEFSNFPLEQLTVFVKHFHDLWRSSQWKRERFAPSFHIDDESLDPKTWCRFPILSGTNEFNQPS